MATEEIYPGATYLLDPNYGNFTGYRIPAGQLGGTTSIQTANQLSEVNKLLNQGMENTEVSLTDIKVFESIPKNQFKEIERLNKLTGAESSLHSPIIDPAGFTEQGWSQENRQLAERQLWNVVERGHELNPNGNIPITIHAAGMISGSEMIPDKEKGEIMGRMIAVNRDTGEMTALKREKLYGPEYKLEGKIQEPKERLENLNHTQWVNAITNLAFYKKEADEILTPAQAHLLAAGGEALTDEQRGEYAGDLERIQRASLFLDNVQASFRNLYEQAAKYGDEDSKKILREISAEWEKKGELMGKRIEEGKDYSLPLIRSQLLDFSINKIQQLKNKPPQIYRPIEEFTKENASETFSNIALKSYEKFGDTAPIISIENPPYGAALSSGKELKELVEKTREEFVKKLSSEGKSKEEAKKIAEKLIGATWDTSHIGMIRKQGFGNEKIVEETKLIAPYVKHLHFNDNLGSTHTDLPPGMGNVPLRDVLEELEKAKFKGKKIFEGGEFFAGFQTSPHPYVLEATGSPMYSTGGGPYWNQMGIPGAYFSGVGAINPPIYHSTWGASFTRLPTELGGAIPGMGDTSQFAGTPNQ